MADTGTAAETAAGAEVPGGARRAGGWQAGCVAVLFLGVLLLAAGALWLSELERGLDGYGQIEEGAGGASAGVADPLAPGGTATYEDGLAVTVGGVRRVPGTAPGTYRFAVTYENHSDGTLRIGEPDAEANVSEYDDAPLVVRAGAALDDGAEDGSTSVWHTSRAAGRRLTAPLGEGERRTVPVRVTVRPGSGHETTLTVVVLPQGGSATGRDAAHWEMTLRG
ncbi:hypothetical protein FM076_21215 [Streptomyces albus subsp. chlorinus]|uniref:hypothetical protein n=1 Tax=Streptomyces albus TaxID=1888 RepID=UPI0015703448|nr:hypothetical protein [Streptomyces albus]NSC23534.1 hypothetical protein [Streptomyces albus subsp. chlorinus]